ncbi:hypothetical protein PT7_2732 [Pusillimonas sp. T7-7]|nr:hypothetical protein PT7_2732 [Pusillimonas sp. T7-7]
MENQGHDSLFFGRNDGSEATLSALLGEYYLYGERTLRTIDLYQFMNYPPRSWTAISTFWNAL